MDNAPLTSFVVYKYKSRHSGSWTNIRANIRKCTNKKEHIKGNIISNGGTNGVTELWTFIKISIMTRIDTGVGMGYIVGKKSCIDTEDIGIYLVWS